MTHSYSFITFGFMTPSGSHWGAFLDLQPKNANKYEVLNADGSYSYYKSYPDAAITVLMEDSFGYKDLTAHWDNGVSWFTHGDATVSPLATVEPTDTYTNLVLELGMKDGDFFDIVDGNQESTLELCKADLVN
jgi:hypothetical protein